MEIITEKQLQFEIEKVINFNLYNKKIIDIDTYEQVNSMLSKQISKEIDVGATSSRPRADNIRPYKRGSLFKNIVDKINDEGGIDLCI